MPTLPIISQAYNGESLRFPLPLTSSRRNIRNEHTLRGGKECLLHAIIAGYVYPHEDCRLSAGAFDPFGSIRQCVITGLFKWNSSGSGDCEISAMQGTSCNDCGHRDKPEFKDLTYFPLFRSPITRKEWMPSLVGRTSRGRQRNTNVASNRNGVNLYGVTDR